MAADGVRHVASYWLPGSDAAGQRWQQGHYRHNGHPTTDWRQYPQRSPYRYDASGEQRGAHVHGYNGYEQGHHGQGQGHYGYHHGYYGWQEQGPYPQQEYCEPTQHHAHGGHLYEGDHCLTGYHAHRHQQLDPHEFGRSHGLHHGDGGSYVGQRQNHHHDHPHYREQHYHKRYHRRCLEEHYGGHPDWPGSQRRHHHSHAHEQQHQNYHDHLTAYPHAPQPPPLQLGHEHSAAEGDGGWPGSGRTNPEDSHCRHGHGAQACGSSRDQRRDQRDRANGTRLHADSSPPPGAALAPAPGQMNEPQLRAADGTQDLLAQQGQSQEHAEGQASELRAEAAAREGCDAQEQGTGCRIAELGSAPQAGGRGRHAAGEAADALPGHGHGAGWRCAGTVPRHHGGSRHGGGHKEIVAKLRAEFADPCARIPYDVPSEPGASTDPRVILLFDLNGTLTSHTSVRKAQGITRVRPGTSFLLRLKEHFRLGIYTSSTVRTAHGAMAQLEEAAGGELFERNLVLHRDHTVPAPKDHVDAGGDPWDTLKPLCRYFAAMHRVILVDDDSYKSIQGEEANMLLVPCWQDSDTDCSVLRMLSDLLLELVAPLPQDADVRSKTAELSSLLRAATDTCTAVETAVPAVHDLEGAAAEPGAGDDSGLDACARPSSPASKRRRSSGDEELRTAAG